MVNDGRSWLVLVLSGQSWQKFEDICIFVTDKRMENSDDKLKGHNLVASKIQTIESWLLRGCHRIYGYYL